MSKINTKDGTPVGSEHLCLRCSWGQYMTGYRESDRLVLCNNTTPNLVLPFKIYECTNFSDKHRPDWQQMKSLAIDIQPVRVSSRTAGFSTVVETRPQVKPDMDEFEDEAAVERKQ